MTTRLSFLIILSIVALPAACSSPPSEGGDTATDAPMDAAVDLQADVVPGDIFPDRTGSPTDVMPDAAADAGPDRVADAVTDMALDLTPHDVGDEPPPDILPDTCQPDCGGKMCGDDGCGGICGLCEGAQEICDQGQCVCQPACDGKECGEDGCGGECGGCEGGSCEDGVCYHLSDYCLQGNPLALDFGMVYEGTTMSLPIVFDNCGTGEISVVEVGFASGSDPSFGIDPELLAGSLPLTLGPGQSATLSVTFSPVQPSEEVDGTPVPVYAMLVLSTIAPALQYEVQLSGAALDDCPVAVITCSNPCWGVAFQDVEGRPQLYGDQSYAPLGTVTGWAWTSEYPQADTFLPSADHPNPKFGCTGGSPHRVYLTVFDQDGQPSCKPAEHLIYCWK